MDRRNRPLPAENIRLTKTDKNKIVESRKSKVESRKSKVKRLLSFNSQLHSTLNYQLSTKKMYKAFFFDMDGVLFDSMPHHAEAWCRVMAQYGIAFPPRECYINEGRTGKDVIERLSARDGKHLTPDDVQRIYNEKTRIFHELGGAEPLPGIREVLEYLKERTDVWVVTGGGQYDLYDQLDRWFPGIFRHDKIVTAHDVTHGKPHPEPYLKAWERSGLQKEDCCVVENAPLGIKAAKAAGLFTVGVNTGILERSDLSLAGADRVFNDMTELREWIVDS